MQQLLHDSSLHTFVSPVGLVSKAIYVSLYHSLVASFSSVTILKYMTGVEPCKICS